MEYNTSRTSLRMPEYGRNVQKMVEYLKTIEDREERQKHAEAIIDIMAVLHPQFKRSEEYHNNLWDHLFVIADYDLDVDCPYPVMTKEIREAKPEPLPYPSKLKKNKHLGRNINKVIDLALEEEDVDKQRGFTNAIAYYMKLAYNNWHHEMIHDDMIREELMEMTDGVLNLEDNINMKHSLNKSRQRTSSRRHQHQSRNQRGGNHAQGRNNNSPRSGNRNSSPRTGGRPSNNNRKKG